jgi:cytochrome b
MDQHVNQQNRVWDIYTRLFHWLLVASIAYQYYSAEIADDAIDNHALLGYTLLGMIIWRVLWGFVGPEPARFSAFVPSPSALREYLAQSPKPVHATHNPLGALAVVAFLVIIALQGLSGLFMTDDILFAGEFHYWLSEPVTEAIMFFHNNAFNLLLALIVIHIVAVIWHQRTSEPFIIRAMFNGNKPLGEYRVKHTLQLHLTCVVCILIAALKVYLLVNHVPDWLGIEAADMFDF